jgi:hypothetical protein
MRDHISTASTTAKVHLKAARPNDAITRDTTAPHQSLARIKSRTEGCSNYTMVSV